MRDEELRTMERALTSGDEPARIAFRRAVERAGRGGSALGLAVGDAVEIRSCLPGMERVFRGRVTGVASGVPEISTPIRLSRYEKIERVDVTGCARCRVTLIRPRRPAR
jgi:hypothetical protein